MAWLQREEWRKWGHGEKPSFLIAVKHWLDRDPGVQLDYVGSYGPHHWNVYAYIYPSHPRFNRFKGNDHYQNATEDLPLHGGPTFLQYHFDKDMNVCAIQVGSDYGHSGDEYFSGAATNKDAREVFQDAEALFNFLQQEVPTSEDK